MDAGWPPNAALGARELGEEESENFTFGAVLDLDNGLSLTVDWFGFQLKRVPPFNRVSMDLAVEVGKFASSVGDERILVRRAPTQGRTNARSRLKPTPVPAA